MDLPGCPLHCCWWEHLIGKFLLRQNCVFSTAGGQWWGIRVLLPGMAEATCVYSSFWWHFRVYVKGLICCLDHQKNMALGWGRGCALEMLSEAAARLQSSPATAKIVRGKRARDNRSACAGRASTAEQGEPRPPNPGVPGWMIRTGSAFGGVACIPL